jgi:hypothetical protein
MNGEIEITVGDVSDIEARVYARYITADDKPGAPAARTTLRGTLRGPHCELARTLPAIFMFHDMPSETTPTAVALVTDPCTWSAELPHVYQCDVVAEQDGNMIAEYHGPIGFRRK